LILQGGTEDTSFLSVNNKSLELSLSAREGVAVEERVKRRALERQGKCKCYSRTPEVQVAVATLGRADDPYSC